MTADPLQFSSPMLFATMVLVRVSVPWFASVPLPAARLPEKVLLVIVIVPAFRIAPPSLGSTAELSENAKDQIHILREKEAENNFLIGKFYEKQKKYSSAKIYYTTVVEDYKNTSWASKALAKIRELNLKIDTR